MNCPKCRNPGYSERVDLSDGLKALECRTCHGHWLPRETYGRWLRKHGDTLPEMAAEEGFDAPRTEPEKALICPDCGHILIKASVGRGLTFHIDRCFHCGGIWLDANEWKSLESRNLHDEIHFMYSRVWQRREDRSDSDGEL